MKMVVKLCIIWALTAIPIKAQAEIESLQELKGIQARVKKVVEANMDVTVSVRTKAGAFGSGVVVSADGLILTAAHVIRGAKQVEIIFPDGKTQQAKVLGANFSKDTAMCKMIESGPWKFAPVASSEELAIGQFVVAVGHAFGFDPLRTPPVRFGRILSKHTNYFVTTDCTLIGGDSGGPLFDLKGQVVGIHSNIGDTWATNNHAGITGFKQDWDRLLKGDQWGVLSINPMTNPESPAIGITMGRELKGGVEVYNVVPEGPSAKAGLAAGDVIQKLNDKKVSSSRELVEEILRNNAGDAVIVTVLRGRKLLEFDLTLGRRELFNNLKK